MYVELAKNLIFFAAASIPLIGYIAYNIAFYSNPFYSLLGIFSMFNNWNNYQSPIIFFTGTLVYGNIILMLTFLYGIIRGFLDKNKKIPSKSSHIQVEKEGIKG